LFKTMMMYLHLVLLLLLLPLCTAPSPPPPSPCPPDSPPVCTDPSSVPQCIGGVWVMGQKIRQYDPPVADIMSIFALVCQPGIDLITLFGQATNSRLEIATRYAWKKRDIQTNPTYLTDSYIFAAPGAVSWASDRIDVLYRSNSSVLTHRYYNGSAWSSPVSLAGVTLLGTPAVTWRTVGTLDVAILDSSNVIRLSSYSGGVWSGVWENVTTPAATTTAPTLVASSATQIDLFVRLSNGTVVHKFKNVTTWSSTWDNLGSGPGPNITTNSLSVINAGVGVFHMVSRTATHDIQYRWTDGAGTWSQWYSMGQTTTQNPTIALGPAGVTIFYLDGTGTPV